MNTPKQDKSSLTTIFLAFSQHYRDHGKTGADMLRDCIDFINSRNEARNTYKTPVEILKEFSETLLD